MEKRISKTRMNKEHKTCPNLEKRRFTLNSINITNMEAVDILIQIRKIIRSIDIESKKIQKEYGVSIPQYLCLSFLHNSFNYQSTQGEIRKFLNLNASTVSGIINRLEKKDLIARLPKFGDKRMINIALTTTGDQLLTNMPSILHERLSEKLKRLNPNELSSIYNGLDSLINILDIEQIEAAPIFALNLDNEDI